ncbi:hypothetical protein [Kineosporia babensis]|uniref:ApeI dehydratase-like domain-containing protein n=1 Tax=Kineosporia babensis TaxID=499548 RepID=A0A9X1NB88_9ACTN|nr:hypothetical protein [Kineosporia babensis]MCD5312032.1 hypothetical protein [Kineosporia babensis]
MTQTSERLIVKVTTPVNHPVFQGHYPGFPLVPGAYLVDVVSRAFPDRSELLEVEQCRFVGPTFPGEEIVADITADGPLYSAMVTAAGRPSAQIRFRRGTFEPAGTSSAVEDLPVILDRAAIAGIVPHRPPILLADQVSELVPGRRATVHHTVPDEPVWLEPVGEFLPPALLLESWAQAALVMLLAENPHPDVNVGGVPVAGTAERVTFGPRVRPGMRIDHEITFVRNLGGMSIVRGGSRVNGVPVLEIGRLVTTLASIEQLLVVS